MAFKFWCIAPSHPLVTQVADKYGLSKKQAKTIINKTRQNNPALVDDDLSLKDIEDDDAFKSALGEYVQTIVEREDALLQDVKGVAKTKDELRAEMKEEDLGLTDDEIEDILNRREELGQSVQMSHISASDIAKVLRVFKNVKRLEAIGQYICRRSQELVTLLETNPEIREQVGIQQKAERKDYFIDSDSATFIRNKVIDDLNVAIDNITDGSLQKENPEEYIEELETAIKNYHTILYMYGGNMFRDEGIEVTPPGVYANNLAEASSEERNDTDNSDPNDDDDDTDGEKKVSDFSSSKQNQSVTSKLVPTIKILLSNCREMKSNGEYMYDDDNYGFVEYISVPHAVASLLNICNGCQTFKEMFDNIKIAAHGSPWMQQLVTALDNSNELSENGVTKSTSSRKGQLQTMFFQSMRKQFMPFKHTYIQYQDGFMCFINADSNISHKYDRIMRNVRTKFFRMSGLPIFANGVIRFEKINKIGQDCLNNISLNAQYVQTDLRNAINDNDNNAIKTAEKNLADIEEQMLKNLESLGIKVSKKTFGEFLSKKPFGFRDNLYDNPTQEKYYIRTSNLVNIARWTKNLTDEFAKWHRYMTENEGKVNDNPSSNPFSGKRGMVTFEAVRGIRNMYENIAENISTASPDSFESMARMAGKSYYSWNNPSSIQTIIENLSKDGETVKRYIERKYGADRTWFCKPNSNNGEIEFYSDVLNDIYHNGWRGLQYAEKPIVNETGYEDLPDLVYAISIMNDYFDNKGQKEKNLAWYKMLIPSDKPRYGMVRMKRYGDRSTDMGIPTENHYQNVITRKALNFFAQELRRSENVARFNALKDGTRIDGYDPKMTDDVKAVYDKMKNRQPVTHEDVVKNGRYIFRGSGVSFYLNKFINEEIEKNSELGNYVIDIIFNSHMRDGDVALIDEEIVDVFKKGFQDYMARLKNHFISHLENIGAFEYTVVRDEEGDETYHARFLKGNMDRWHSDDEDYTDRMFIRNSEAAREYALNKENPENAEDYDNNAGVQTYYKELVTFFEDVDEFIYNNWLAKVNMSELFDVDLAFYGDTSNFQKRNAQIVSAGYPIDPDAKIHGERVSDGKYRTITLKTEKIKSKHIKNVEVALRKLLDYTDNEEQKRQLEAGIDDVVEGLKKFDPTDGQGLTSLTGLRKRLAGLGEWSISNTKDEDRIGYVLDENEKPQFIDTDEAVYNRFKRNWSGEHDKEAMVQDFLHVFAQTQKPFVYTFANVDRDGRTVTVPVQLKNSEYALVYISAFMRSAARDSQLAAIARFLEESAEADSKTGIDSVNFDTVVKIGNNNRSIDISGQSADQVLKTLEKECYEIQKQKGKKYQKKYRNGTVIEYDVQDYKIVQKKDEHFKHNQQPLGSQIKMLSINNIPLDAMISLPDGKQITGKELRDRYFNTLKRKYAKSEYEFRKSLGLDSPYSVRVNRLSNVLKRAMATDQKFTVEMRRGMSIVNRNGVDQFVIPLDEPGQQGAVEAMMFSKIRRTFYKEKTNGGIVVQATSWGAADDLFIRFKSTNEDDIKNNGGLLLTRDQFQAKHKDLSEDELDEQYGAYAKEFQGDYDHFEIECPMPNYVRKMLEDKNGKIDKKYFNDDGSWNMDEIRKVVPESAFDAICYRIPTEAKYSIMVCKIKRFSPEWAGSTAKYPKELTEFTGSDFDIDTDYVELRPMPGSPSADIDNEIFDLQLAALRSMPVTQETFKRGDFSDLSDMSYRDVLIRIAKMPVDYVNSLSTKEAKELCKAAEDLDLMDPSTDIILKNQNSDAGKMIGIAAVSVLSHAFISTFNELDIHDSIGKNSGNFTRIRIHNTKDNHRGFVVVNDKDSEHPTRRAFSEFTILDPMHDMDGNLVSTQLSKYVGASADAAKDAALYRLNITKATLPILAMMHRIGISGDVARAFISQPVVRDVVRKLNSQSAFGSKKIEKAIENVMDDIEAESGNPNLRKDARASKNKALVYSELMENKAHPEKQSDASKMQTLVMLLYLNEISQLTRNLDSFSRYNSATAMKGSTYFSRYVERKKIERLRNNLGEAEDDKRLLILPDNVTPAEGFTGESEFGKLCAMFPHIAQVIFGEDDLMEKIILENMHTYSTGFFEAVRRLRITDDDGDTEGVVKKLEKLYTGWKNYLLFVGPNRIADFHNEATARAYTRNIAQEFFEFMEDLEKKNPEFYNNLMENNTFIQSLGYAEAKENYGEFFVISTDVAALSGVDIDAYQRDWEALLDMPEMKKPNGKSWATELAIHFLARSAAFARDTPVTRMPNRVKEALGSYTKAFEEADRYNMSYSELSNFIAMFCLNNSAKEDGIVPYFYENKEKSVNVENITNDAGEVVALRLTFGDKYKTQFLNYVSKEEGLTFEVPVIAVYDRASTRFYALPDGKVTEEGSDEGGHTYSVMAFPIEPLGIPGQISEYVGFSSDRSIFLDSEQETPNPNENGEKASTEPFPDNTRPLERKDMVSKRGGSYILSSPFDTLPSSQFSSMAKDLQNTNNGYLESRTHLYRAKRIIESLGLKLGGINRGASKNTPEYTINVKPTKETASWPGQYNSARQAAAMISVLGNRLRATTVKTYITDSDQDFSHVEFVIPIDKKASMFKKNIDLILNMAGSKYDAEYNNDTNELTITAEVDDVDNNDVTKVMRAVNEAANYAKNVQKMLKAKGLASNEKMTFNTLMYEKISPEDAINILKSIYDESRAEEFTEQPREENSKDAVGGGNRERSLLGLKNIISIAERRQRAENVTEELRQLFGERRFPLRNTGDSYTSGQLVDAVIDDLNSTDENLVESIKDKLYDKDGGKYPDVNKAVENLIINTANWILANRSEEDAVKMMEGSGISSDDASTIINTINDLLEEMDIC